MTKQYTINELYKILGALIEDGYGNREFQLYYDSETVYTTIPKGSRILVLSKAIRFTDNDDGTCHIDEYMEKLDDEIKQLKNDLTHEKRVNKRFNESLLDMEKHCKRFEKENKKLKKQLNEYRQQRDDVYTTSKNPMRFV